MSRRRPVLLLLPSFRDGCPHRELRPLTQSRHVHGTRHVSAAPSPPPSSHLNESSPGSVGRMQSVRPSPSEHGYAAAASESPSTTDAPRTPQPHQPPTPTLSIPSTEAPCPSVDEPVVARISFRAVREERAFQIAKNVILTADPHAHHMVKPLDLIRLSPAPGDRGVILVAIYACLGPNYLSDVLDMGPAFYNAVKQGDSYVSRPRKEPPVLKPPIHLDYFLDFAIGAARCLEILHYSQGMIHGEIRGDAFHFNADDNRVRIVSFGSGIRSFEYGLTSTGWSTLSKELGAKNKLLYISPEQTGRMPAEPDTRTDIYSLGVLLWTLLTQKPAYRGDTPLDIVQAVLARRIPNASTIRTDIPDVIGRIIQKCTAKSIADRYHSASGLKHDLVMVQKLLGDGDSAALLDMEIGTKDVSSFFMLPTSMIGRHGERDELVKVISRVAQSHALGLSKAPTTRFSDGSSLPNEVLVADDLSSEGASSADGTNRRSGSFTHTASSDPKHARSNLYPSILSDAQTISNDTISSSHSAVAARATRRPWERHHSSSMDASSAIESLGIEGPRSGMTESSASSLSRQLGNAKFRRRGHCEVVTIQGAGGLGKSFLVQSVLPEARRRGYCATAKFDTTRRTAFGPLLKLLSSLFKQVWGERNTETPFHQGLKHYVRPVWPMLHRALGLPEFLLGPPDVASARSVSSAQSATPRGNAGAGLKRRGSSPGCSPRPLSQNPTMAPQTSQEYLCAGTSTKTTRLMNVCLDMLRVFTTHKFICFCLDDVHFADDESLELITQIISAKMKMVIIMTYRPEELSAAKMESIISPSQMDGEMQTRNIGAELVHANTSCRLSAQQRAGGDAY